MDEQQKEFMRKLADRKRAILLGTLPIQPLFWYGVNAALPEGLGAFLACMAGLFMSVLLTWEIGGQAITRNRN